MHRKDKNMHWDYKQIRRLSWNLTFRRGFRVWLLLALVGFLFAFAGAADTDMISFLDVVDRFSGGTDPRLPGHVNSLKEYLADTPLVQKIPFLTTEVVGTFVDRCSQSTSWILKLLASNIAYFERNKGEVLAVLLIGSAIAAFFRFFVLNVAIIGRNRYVMENRFALDVPLHRIFSVFHLSSIWNMIKVMFWYTLTLRLWSLTIIGGIYKSYQYYMVPYLLAENPNITWKEAKKLSAKMTNGYKIKIFLTHMSFIYIWVLRRIPLVGLFVVLPLEMQLEAEMYFTLRSNPVISAADADLLTEPAFGGNPCMGSAKAAPEYVLRDLEVRHPAGDWRSFNYSLTDFILMFFVFSIAGWLWECGLYIVRDHLIVNRGSLYGPWVPIYGAGGVFIVLLLNRFKDHKIKLFMLGVMLCAVLEYLASFVLEILFNSSYWDYHQDFMNLNGRIYLVGMIGFGLGGMAAVYLVAPMLSRIASHFRKKTQIIISAVLCAAFLSDLICCIIFGFNSGNGVGGSI